MISSEGSSVELGFALVTWHVARVALLCPEVYLLVFRYPFSTVLTIMRSSQKDNDGCTVRERYFKGAASGMLFDCGCRCGWWVALTVAATRCVPFALMMSERRPPEALLVRVRRPAPKTFLAPI